MFENRISGLFQPSQSEDRQSGGPSAATGTQFLPLASTQDIYQAAQARARYDYELDVLFNPEHYGDQGSGI